MNTNWVSSLLGDVINLKRGYDLPKRKRVGGSIPIVSSSGISGTHNEAKVSGPGVITGRYGTLGEVFYVTSDFWPLNTTLYVQDFKGNDERFISYFLRTLGFENRNAAGAVPGVNRNHLHKLEVETPPVPEQRKIASILSAYDDLIENNTRRIAILEEMAQAVYREWFVNFKFPGHENAKFVESDLGRIPDGWECSLLSDLGFVGRGKSRHRPRNAPELYDGPYPLFQTGDIKAASTFLVQHRQTYSEAGLAQSKLWEPGTLCITIAANIADTAILSKRSCFPDSVVGFVPKSEVVCVYFVKLYLDSIKRQMENVSKGTTQDNLSLDKLLRFKVPMPRKQTMAAFDEAVTPMFNQVLSLIRRNNNLRATRDLLLPKLISGKLNVEDLDIGTGVDKEQLLEATA